MELFEAIAKRASVRNLSPTEISIDELEIIVNAGIAAPSGCNIQPREFIIITDPEVIKQLAPIQDFISEASAIIAVICDPAASDYWLEDMAAAVENMLLAITALGYASCWVEGTLLRKEEQMKKVLAIPAEKRLMTILPIGNAAAEVTPAKKKNLAQTTYYNSYGRRR